MKLDEVIGWLAGIDVKSEYETSNKEFLLDYLKNLVSNNSINDTRDKILKKGGKDFLDFLNQYELKVPKDKDLKKLINFGFTIYRYTPGHEYYVYPNIKDNTFYIHIESRAILVNNIITEEPLKVFYNLIQNGFVELIKK